MKYLQLSLVFFCLFIFFSCSEELTNADSFDTEIMSYEDTRRINPCPRQAVSIEDLAFELNTIANCIAPEECEEGQEVVSGCFARFNQITKWCNGNWPDLFSIDDQNVFMARAKAKAAHNADLNPCSLDDVIYIFRTSFNEATKCWSLLVSFEYSCCKYVIGG